MSLFSNRRRYITEMAKNAYRRIYDKLSPEKKQFYLTDKALNELIADKGQTDRQKASLKNYIIQNSFDWDNYVALINDRLDIDLNSISWSELVRKFNASSYHKLFARIERTVERNKDDIDRNYYDKGMAFRHKTTKQYTSAQDAYDQLNLAEFIDWFQHNPEEALDRFGAKTYKNIKRDILRWTMPQEEYKSSKYALADQWFDLCHVIRNPNLSAEEKPKMSEELAYKLALFIQEEPENAKQLLANNIETNWASVNTTVLDFFRNNAQMETLPSVEECRAFLSSDARRISEEVTALIENEIPTTIQIPLRNGSSYALKVKEIVKKYFSDNPRIFRNGGVIGDAVGSPSSSVVSNVCRTAMTRLNTHYKTDTDKPFNAHTLQEFYDTYKPVFKLGLTEEHLTALFESFAKDFKDNA